MKSPVYTQFSAHIFSSLEDAPFSAADYSMLKFGCGNTARSFGEQLAESLFVNHGATLIANQCVVFSSPYNHVRNAASLMTEHMVNRLNAMLVINGGRPVETTIVHRKVSYINDYGFLNRDQRKTLISNDSFYLNKEFLEGKLLLCVDDIRITGTHEERLIDVFTQSRMQNDAYFLYFAMMHGTANPDIESKLNLAHIKTAEDFAELMKVDGTHMCVRPMKFALSQPPEAFAHLLAHLPHHHIEGLYHGALAEGYYKLPAYQTNFNALRAHISATN